MLDPTARLDTLEAALRRQKKQDLIALLRDLATADAVNRHFLEQRLSIQPPPADVATDVARAIEEATYVDPRDAYANMNIDYDLDAYERAGAGLKSLVAAGDLAAAKALSLELMKRGSYQCECSDEALMVDELAECLTPVIAAVKQEDRASASAWAREMLAADRIEFICHEQLGALARKR